MGKSKQDQDRRGMFISARALKEKNDDIKRMKIDLVIENNAFDRRLSLDLISEKTRIGKSEVQRILHRHGGIRRYIKRYRLQQAYIDLVLSHRSTISRVVEKYGFASLSGFATVFEKEYDCYPWELVELGEKRREYSGL